jgi:hypothetical protein
VKTDIKSVEAVEAKQDVPPFQNSKSVRNWSPFLDLDVLGF